MKDEKAQRIRRNIEILKLLSEGKWVSLHHLAKRLGVSHRTIQRDIKLLIEAGFPVVRKSPKSGMYRLEKDLTQEIEMLTESDLAFILAIKDALAHMGEAFSQSAREIVSGILEAKREPVSFGMDFPIPLTKEREKVMKEILKAIKKRKQIAFFYGAPNQKDSPKFKVKPYKLGFYRGFWYLVAEHKDILKNFAMDKIQKLEILKAGFNMIPKEVEEITDFTPFISEKERVKIKVKTLPKATEYFERKKFALGQKPIKKDSDNSAIFQLEGRNLYELENTVIKQWLPYIIVLEPRDFAQSLVEKMEDWLSKQKKALEEVGSREDPQSPGEEKE